MNIADKLALIASNTPKVYEAGRAAGGGFGPFRIYINTIHFDDGLTETDTKIFEHGLGVEPIFAAIYADDVEAIKAAYTTSPMVVQTDRLRDYTRTALRYDGDVTVSTVAGTSTSKLICEWTSQYIKVGSPAASYIWPGKNISTFTLICVGPPKEEGA